MSRSVTSVLCAVLLAQSSPAAAQALRDACASGSRADVRTFCGNIADAAEILQSRIGIGLTGGNPVPGTASTLGMRLGALPRVGIGLRVSAADVELAPVERVTTATDVEFAVGSIAVDATVGLFQGLNLTPSAGGFASFDLLASAGTMPLPRGEGFDDTAPFTWGFGARLGLLRESFAAPGVSLSAMYRGFGDFTFGSAALTDRDAFFRVTDYRVRSLRATVGKRLLGIGLTAGAGHDRYRADVAGQVRDPGPTQPLRVIELREAAMTTSRTSVFGNVSYNFLILSIVGELGWQRGGDAIENAHDARERAGLFGGVALRIGI